MKKNLTILLLAFFSILKTNGQLTQFDSLNNKMFFNILISEPDSSVIEFVKSYFPYHAEKIQSTWTIEPPDTTLPIPYRSEHNFIFEKHPFFKINFQEGKLEFSAIEEKNYLPRLQLPRVSFCFINKKQAEVAIEYFKAQYKKIGCNLKSFVQGQKKTIIISNPNPKIQDSVGFVLYKNSLDHKYRILFSFKGIIMELTR